LTERLQGAGVDRQTRGMEGASDHAPVWAKLRDPNSRTAPGRHVGGRSEIAGATALPKAERSARRTGAGASRRSQVASGGQSVLSRPRC
jgi:hypothetical protein